MGNYEYSFYSDTGGRKNNEDACYAGQIGEDYLFIVADGLGGHECGEIASNLAVAVIRRKFEEAHRAKQRSDERTRAGQTYNEMTLTGRTYNETTFTGQTINEQTFFGELFVAPTFDAGAAIKEANREILAAQRKIGKAMKTTVALAAILGEEVILAHVGDSRIYAFEKNGIVYQSPDHSASQMAVLAGEITPAQIRHHADRNVLTRALGADERLKVDLTRKKRSETDALLLCSDGFWEYITEEEMCREKSRTIPGKHLSWTSGKYPSFLSENGHCGTGAAQKWLDHMKKIVQTGAPRNQDNNTAVVAVRAE